MPHLPATAPCRPQDHRGHSCHATAAPTLQHDEPTCASHLLCSCPREHHVEVPCARRRHQETAPTPKLRSVRSPPGTRPWKPETQRLSQYHPTRAHRPEALRNTHAVPARSMARCLARTTPIEVGSGLVPKVIGSSPPVPHRCATHSSAQHQNHSMVNLGICRRYERCGFAHWKDCM